jgi:ABC-type transport system involved in cytochrome c biogenesis permease subunit
MNIKNNKPIKLSAFIAAVTWSSVIGLVWLLVLREIPIDGVSVTAVIFFFLVAMVASVASSLPDVKQRN